MSPARKPLNHVLYLINELGDCVSEVSVRADSSDLFA